MKLYRSLLLSLFTLSTLLASAQALIEPTRKERKIIEKIDLLNNELVATRKALAEEQFKRGVDTVQHVEEEEIIIEEEVEELTIEIAEVVEEVEVVEVIEEVKEIPNMTFAFNPIQMDSLLCEWREKEALDQFDTFFQQYIYIDDTTHVATVENAPKKEATQILDTLYQKRLTDLASPIGLPYNSIVRNYINRYVSSNTSLMTNVMTRSQYYFPHIEEELIKHNLPLELRAMPIIESALTSTAVSRAGAAGLWQFMPSTGKVYNLEVNSLVDERCDPTKATVAACRFLSDLYRMYGEWSLAIAAYNCGPGNVNKALARSGLKEGTFWDIYYYLPRETRGYVPAFIAASYAYAYHQQHGIELNEPPLPLATDTVTVNKILHLGQVSEVLDIPIELLRQLNPQYRRDIIPATTKTYSLRLPQRYVSPFIEQELAINKLDSTYLKQYIDPANIKKIISGTSGSIYVVKNGDTLGAIARRHNTTISNIMSWNNLRSANKLSIGQRLRVSSSL